MASAVGQISNGALGEMVITTQGNIPGMKSGTGGEANANLRKTGGKRPGFSKSWDLRGRNGEKKFVILPLADGFLGRGSGGQGKLFGKDAKADAGGAGEPREIRAEAVTQIHHGRGNLFVGEPAAFAETGGEG